MTDTSKRSRAAAALADLQRRFPAAFPSDSALVRPLALDTNAAAIAAVNAAGGDGEAAGWAVRNWILRRAYQEALARGGARIALDGSEVDEVSAEHQQAAQDRLAGRATAKTAGAGTRKPKAAPSPARKAPRAPAAKAPAVVVKRAVRAPAPAAGAPATKRPTLSLRKKPKSEG